MSDELHSNLRNYSLGAWRNTRRFVGGPTLREMTDVVQKDAAIRRFGSFRALTQPIPACTASR